MLFRPVCGSDLEEVCRFLEVHGGTSSKGELEYWFVQRSASGSEATNLEEALTVLRSARLCEGSDPVRLLRIHQWPLQLDLLAKFRTLELGIEGGSHALDAWYSRLLSTLFIEPDRVYISEVHKQANRLGPPIPLSDEKMNSWRRVMEWLGVGRRFGVGFLVSYSQALVQRLLETWGPAEGPLQDWVERHVERFLPVGTHHGDLPRAMVQPLVRMEHLGLVELSSRQDSPGKAYLGDRRVKWIKVVGG